MMAHNAEDFFIRFDVYSWANLRPAVTYGQAVAEVMHAVSHDDHPGNAGDTSVLHFLV